MASTFHVVLTLQRRTENFLAQAMLTAVIDVGGEVSRSELLRQATQRLTSERPDLEDGTVLFFDVQPDQL